jgi:hypothetical protein
MKCHFDGGPLDGSTLDLPDSMDDGGRLVWNRPTYSLAHVYERLPDTIPPTDVVRYGYAGAMVKEGTKCPKQR